MATLPLAEPVVDFADAASPLPLPVCWAIWLTASVVLWSVILRMVAYFAI